MSCITLLLASLLPQSTAAESAPSPAETWQQVQQRYSNAGVLGFQAEGRVFSTRPASAGWILARIDADVEVARSGLGAVEVTLRTGQLEKAKTVRMSSLGTAEGVFSVDCAQNLAFPCGSDWAASGELDDFAFLGSTWCSKAARAGTPDSVSFVPNVAEHPGLQGLRVRWEKQGQQPATTTIYWLNQYGFVDSADVRLDAETVLHWSFRNCVLGDEATQPLQAAALPAGCKRGEGQAVEAVAPN